MNEYILAVFSVRSSTMQFSMLLNKNGVKSVVVETPKAIAASCGISVRFDIKNLQPAKEILKRYNLRYFVRFYRVSNFYGKLTFLPIAV